MLGTCCKLLAGTAPTAEVVAAALLHAALCTGYLLLATPAGLVLCCAVLCLLQLSKQLGSDLRQQSTEQPTSRRSKVLGITACTEQHFFVSATVCPLGLLLQVQLRVANCVLL